MRRPAAALHTSDVIYRAKGRCTASRRPRTLAPEPAQAEPLEKACPPRSAAPPRNDVGSPSSTRPGWSDEPRLELHRNATPSGAVARSARSYLGEHGAYSLPRGAALNR